MAASSENLDYVPYYKKDHNSDEERLRRILKDISQVLEMEEFDEELQESLHKDYPKYMEILETRAADLLKKDCAIVFTGETSAGKSSIINLVLKDDILPVDMAAMTNIICKIMHSKQKIIRIFNQDGLQIDEVIDTEVETDSDYEEYSSDFVESSCDNDAINENLCPEEESNRNSPNSDDEEDDDISALEKIFHRADLSSDVHFAEIHHPIRMLEGNIAIVDTPGVGDSEKHNRVLEEYLPYAVAFVFVVNPSSGGGMQGDRIQKVIKNINEKVESMICFDPADVIFVVNKWDTVFVQKGRRKRTQWNNLVEKIKESWPMVNPENIIKMSVKEVINGEQTYKQNFLRFEKALHDLVEKNINKRISNNYRFLEDILDKIEDFVNTRISITSQPMPYLKKEMETTKQILTELERRSMTETLQKCKELLNDKIESHGTGLMKFIASKDFEDFVRNDDAALRGTLRPMIDSLIAERIETAIKNWIEKRDVSFQELLDEILDASFNEIYEELRRHLRKFGFNRRKVKISHILKTIIPGIVAFGIGLISVVVLAPFFSIEITAVAAAVAMVFSFNVVSFFVVTLGLSREQVIEMSFFTRRNAITEDKISHILEKRYGARYRKKAEELLGNVMPQEIENAKYLLENLEKDYDQAICKKDSLLRLLFEISKIRECLQSFHFQDSLN